MKAKLATLLREYFTEKQMFGLCNILDHKGGHCILELFKKYALEWPHAVKVMSIDGIRLCAYMIPASVDDKSVDGASSAYARDLFGDSMTDNPLRRDLANFVVKQIAREQKKKFVPISFDNSNPLR